ncbi:sigma-70 family RNA polymerase sigma factor [Cognatishimia sp. SS12]|uniref:sigma-70 family RNA polymerase sigma factor n=1 Tax=Cognatishimia sp. SS12 TaxID=2979465 RepID=UPI00232F59CB|nr:sigma-70 family RNA polymerase sigma factor [Cognatishimia sp. SS12]MDC0739454.1 sigma-70 family RNA polymerase sigma factor [Cognatishimia sp. SS12]
MVISYAAALKAPMLDSVQERRLITKWQAQRDRAAMQALVTSHARQVHACVRRINRTPDHQEDLLAEGLIGLIQAADRFDLSRDTRFSTYAQWWVQNYVRAANARLRSVIDTPSNARSLAIHDFHGAEEGEGTLEDSLASDDPTPEEATLARAHKRELRQLMAAALTDLGATEQDIVIARNLRQTPEPLEDLAQRLGMGRDRLRQIERRALSRLKYALLARGVTTARMV